MSKLDQPTLDQPSADLHSPGEPLCNTIVGVDNMKAHISGCRECRVKLEKALKEIQSVRIEPVEKEKLPWEIAAADGRSDFPWGC